MKFGKFEYEQRIKSQNNFLDSASDIFEDFRKRMFKLLVSIKNDSDRKNAAEMLKEANYSILENLLCDVREEICVIKSKKK